MEVTFSDRKQRRSLNGEKKEDRLSHCNSTAERRDVQPWASQSDGPASALVAAVLFPNLFQTPPCGRTDLLVYI